MRSLTGGRTLMGPGRCTALTVGFADAGRSAIAVGIDGSLRSWDVRDGAPGGRTLSLGGHWNIAGAAPTRDSGPLFVVHLDNRLTAWDTATGAEIFSRPITCAVQIRNLRCSLAVAADGSSACLLDDCHEVQILDVAASRKTASWRLAEGATVSSQSLSADGRLLVMGVTYARPRANLIEVWETATGRLVQRLAGHAGSILAIDISPDSRQVVSTGSDRTLRVWDLATGRDVSRHGLLPGAGQCLAVSFRNRRALVGTGHLWAGDAWTPASSYGVQVWDLGGGHPLGAFESNSPINAVAVSPDGRDALAAGVDGSLYLWPVPEGQPGRRDAARSSRAVERRGERP